MKTRSSKRVLANAEPVIAAVESLAHDGRGVTHVGGKAVFIHGALPGETVRYQPTERHKDYDVGEVIDLLSAAPSRVEPACSAYGLCGGCSLQHLDSEQQILAKQQILLDNLDRIGKVTPAELLPPLTGPAWGYRHKTRLGVKFVVGKGRLLVGFRERRSALIADMRECRVLHPRLGQLLQPLAECISGLDIRSRLPQIEAAVGDEAVALVLRVLSEPTVADLVRLREFARQHAVQIHLQTGGPEQLTPLEADYPELFYRLPDFDLTVYFHPTGFTQVNHELNRRMVRQVVELLQPQPHERVLDLFCGLGNFTLPLARRAAQVVGVEADAGLIARARHNAERNGLTQAEFQLGDLYDGARLAQAPWRAGRYDAALLDPPRSGAREVLPLLPALGVQRLVYVSCHPGSLARDAGILVHEHGYRLCQAGVMDMFPQTSHVEALALFERG